MVSFAYRNHFFSFLLLKKFRYFLPLFHHCIAFVTWIVECMMLLIARIYSIYIFHMYNIFIYGDDLRLLLFRIATFGFIVIFFVVRRVVMRCVFLRPPTFLKDSNHFESVELFRLSNYKNKSFWKLKNCCDK